MKKPLMGVIVVLSMVCCKKTHRGLIIILRFFNFSPPCDVESKACEQNLSFSDYEQFSGFNSNV